MIGGIVMILTVVWVYQTLIKTKTSNLLMWVAGCAAIFLAVQFMSYNLNIMILDAFDGKDISDQYERDLTSVGDRKTQEDDASGGSFLPYLFELLPPSLGFLTIAFIRNRFILKEALNVANLFSGIKDMFMSIKNSFKTSNE